METTGAGTADRDLIVRTLREIAALLRARGESEYRARAYDTAASRLGQVQGDLAELVASGRLTEIPGIGDALAARIAEIAQTGRSEYLERLRGEFPSGIAELMRVQGLGVKKAVALWKAIGVEDVASLEEACREHRVRDVPGFGAKIEAKLIQSIEALKSAPPPTENRLLGHVLPGLEALVDTLTRSGAITRGSIAGGARRACEELDDAAVVLAARDADEVWAGLERAPTVARVGARDGGAARLQLFDRDVALTAHVVAESAFGAALLFATGSPAHVARLVAIAERKGLSLTDRGLFRGGKPLAARDEEAVYRLLELPWVPPELREDQGELDAAIEGTLPKELLRESDLRGLIHSHSTWSDGTNSLEEMAKAAKGRGFSYLTVTEHSPTASYAGGLTIDDIQRQWDEIDRLNEELRPFRLLKGIESDILKDGALDFPPRILARLEVVIGSIHNRYGLGEKEMTERILRAMDDPHLHILGHFTGRLLQRRPPIPVRVDDVLDKAAETGVVLEVNGNPHRLDLNARHVRQALRRGIKLVASADSHSTSEIGHTRYAVLTARKGWAQKADVLNTLDAAAFLRRLKKNRSR